MAKAAKKPEPKSVVEIFDEIEQGSREWLEARCGLITASNFSLILRNGREGRESTTRLDYMHRLAGEIITGEPAEESFKSNAMKRGTAMEPEARDYYARTNFAELRRVGFVKRTLPNGIVVGASPDSLVGKDGGLEIKTMAPHLLIAQIERPGIPPQHRPQLHGTMWVADLEWMDLLIFYRGMPALKFRVDRNEKDIAEISDAVETFDWELKKLVEKIRKMSPR